LLILLTAVVIFILTLPLILLSAPGSGGASSWVTADVERTDVDLSEEAERFQQALDVISRRYVGEIADEADLIDAAIAAAVHALGDPWSHFLTAEQYAAYLESLRNRQQGIGIMISRDEETGEAEIIGVEPGSPAEEAGLVAGDTIVTIEDYYVAEMGPVGPREHIHAQYGGTVRLGVRDAAGEMRDVEVEVRTFYTIPVTFEMLEGDVGYIRISEFAMNSGRDTVQAIDELLNDGAAGLIFDVRNNPGGALRELLLILDHLIPDGELFILVDYTGEENVHYARRAEYVDVPVVVLVNEWSASAAEYFAAILQERDRAVIVGEPTTGKGRSQRVFPLADGRAVVLSTHRYLTPERVDLSEVGGIVPDEVIEGADVQLERGIQLIMNN